MIFLVPTPEYIGISSNQTSPIQPIDSAISLTCTVELGPAVMDSDLSLLIVETQLSRDGTELNITDQKMTGTTFIYTYLIDSFGRNDSGNYNCTATVRPLENSMYLIVGDPLSNTTRVTTGDPKFDINYCKFTADLKCLVHRSFSLPQWNNSQQQ